MKNIKLDKIDRQIIDMLSENARLSNVAIAKALDMVPSGILKRIQNLENSGVIERYETRISAPKVGLGLSSFVLVNSNEALGKTEAAVEIAKLSEVQEVHYMAGDFMYMLKVRVRDSSAYVKFIKKLGKIKGIRDCRSIMILDTIKETAALKIAEEQQS